MIFPKLTPLDWEFRLLELPPEVRQTVGRHICWDLYFDYIVARTPPDVAAFIKKYGRYEENPAAEEDVIEALMELGISEKDAKHRVMGHDTSKSKHYSKRKTDAQKERNKVMQRLRRLKKEVFDRR